MQFFFDNFYFPDDPLKSLIGILAFAFIFEFVLSFAYVLKGGRRI